MAEIKNLNGDVILKSKNPTDTIKELCESQPFLLTDADLPKVMLIGANLPWMEARRANLQDAYFDESNLRNSDFHRANLERASFVRANLSESYLQSANLQKAEFRYANLQGVSFVDSNLSGASFSHANLFKANLEYTNLSGANLRYVNLLGASLQGANLEDAQLPAFQIPQEGDLIGYKKVADRRDAKVIKLLIPKDAKRTASLVGRKCRAEFALCLEGAETPVRSFYNADCMYKNGDITRPDKYDDDIRIECTHGIHFFVTRQEAEDFSM